MVMPDDDEPRWDHRAHYDQAMAVLGTDAPGSYQIAMIHMLGALYRLLAQDDYRLQAARDEPG